MEPTPTAAASPAAPPTARGKALRAGSAPAGAAGGAAGAGNARQQVKLRRLVARLSPPAAAVIESWQPGGLDAEQRAALAVVNHICEDQSDGLRHEKQWVLTQVGQKIVPHLRGSAAAANRLRLIASRNDATPPRLRRMLDGCADHGSEPAGGGVGAAGAGRIWGADAVRSRGQGHRGGRWAVQISSSAGRRRVRRRDQRDGDCAVLGRPSRQRGPLLAGRGLPGPQPRLSGAGVLVGGCPPRRAGGSGQASRRVVRTANRVHLREAFAARGGARSSKRLRREPRRFQSMTRRLRGHLRWHALLPGLTASPRGPPRSGRPHRSRMGEDSSPVHSAAVTFL